METKDYLNYVLEDDNTETGGVSFVGETLKDFLDESGKNYDIPLSVVNFWLKQCGIKPIPNGAKTDRMKIYGEIKDIIKVYGSVDTHSREYWAFQLPESNRTLCLYDMPQEYIMVSSKGVSMELALLNDKELQALYEEVSGQSKKEKIMNILCNMSSISMNTFMHKAGLWNEVQSVFNFSPQELGLKIGELNSNGFNVRLILDIPHDEYVLVSAPDVVNVYGQVTLTGLMDTREEWISALHLEEVVETICNDSEMEKVLYEIYDYYK